MSVIFISYAIEDLDRIKPLVKALEEVGWSVWWDRRILPGKTWEEVIEAALADAKCVLVVWSVASIASEWVRAEAEDARDRGVLVPVMFDEVRIPLSFRRIQAASLVGWAGDSIDKGFADLSDAIRDVIGRGHGEKILTAREGGSTTTAVVDHESVEARRQRERAESASRATEERHGETDRRDRLLLYLNNENLKKSRLQWGTLAILVSALFSALAHIVGLLLMS